MGNHTDARNFGHREVTAAEMESLASFCEAVLPPVPHPKELLGEDDHHPNKEALRSFYTTCGSQTPVARLVHALSLFIDHMVRVLNGQTFGF